MKRIMNKTNLETLKVAGFLWVFTLAFVSSAQFSADLNPHIKADQPAENIVYSALKKGFISLKAEIQLVEGELMCRDGHSFEDIYLAPLFSRYQENGERFYQNYTGLFYLFIESDASDIHTLEALEKTLHGYEDMMANTKWNTQRNRLKVVMIDPSEEVISHVLTHKSSPISVEGNATNYGGTIDYLRMPVVGLDYEKIDRNELAAKAKTLHRQGKKLRLYDVPNDQVLWKSLMREGADFINIKRSQEILAQGH